MNSNPSSISVRCPICGADDFAVLYGSGVAQVNQIVKCKRCSLMYANPRRQADCEEMRNWADDPTWDMERENRVRFEKERVQVKDLDDTREMLRLLHPARGKVLEVGSSLGFTLQAFRQEGWDVMGVEPDRNAWRYATQKLNIPTINGTLETAELPPDEFDVAVMLHVVEHVPDPIGTLRALHRVLKPGGHLVLETPRFDSLMFKLLGAHERSMRCDGHITFFTRESLMRCCKAAGFASVHWCRTGRTVKLERLAMNLSVMTRNGFFSKHLASLFRAPMLRDFHVTINVGDIQRLCLVKPLVPLEPGADPSN
ncbi:MAG: class I SAM-dependent methyltransferase [Polyangiaceae bacterium]